MLRRADRGTVLLLMPAAVFVMLVLGAIVLDVGLSRVRAQELRSVAASAANDSLGALDIDELRSSGTIVISQARAEVLAAESVAQGPLPDATVEDVEVALDPLGRWEIVVRVGLDVELVIAPALPGAPDSLHVTATERVLVIP